MSRYIDIDDISLRKTISVGGLSAKALWRRIQQEPSIDLVRCTECIWRDKDNQGEAYCTYVKGLADINEDSFCSYGEREGE